jgi:broad specificity phosphatase PhoE
MQETKSSQKSFSAEDLLSAITYLESMFFHSGGYAKTIWLIRHADAYDNLQSRNEDIDNPGLSERGKMQAEKLAKRLEQFQPELLISSPAKRAIQTAEIVGEHLGLKLEIDQRFQEVMIEMPISTGHIKWLEDIAEVGMRVENAIKEIAESSSATRIVIVSHGGAISALISQVLGHGDGFLRLLPDYTSITKLRYGNGKLVAYSLLDCCHLE